MIANTSATDNGQIAVGQNALVAFMSWGGANYEDAIVISERLVKDSKFSTIHMDEIEVSVRDTKLGPEVTTPTFPMFQNKNYATWTRKELFASEPRLDRVTSWLVK